MKNIISITLIAFISFGQSTLFSQEDSTRKIFFGISGGMSFFDPSGVNGYIKNYLSAKNELIESGFSDIVLNLSLKLDLSYKVNENIDLSGIIDLAFAPKIIVITNSNNTESFSFNRYSPGATFDYYIGGRKDNKLILGAGILYNFMGFQGYTGSGISFRMEAGKSIQVGSIKLKFMGIINIMPPIDGKNQGTIVELNYTDVGLSLGIEI